MTGDWLVFTALVWGPALLLVLAWLTGCLYGPTVGDLLDRDPGSDSMGVTVGEGDGEGSLSESAD